MNILKGWIDAPWAAALGSALAHFLWEGALIALLLGAALAAYRGASARLRYGLAVIALFAMPVAFSVTFALSLPAQPSDSLHRGAHAVLPPRFPPPAPADGEDAAGRLWDRLPYAVPFWLAGVILFYARNVAALSAARRLRRVGVCAVHPPWEERLAQLAGRMGLARPVALLESCLVGSPVVIGLVKPVILTPVGLLAGMPAELLEAVLLHELAHIRRRDWVVNMMQGAVEGLLFYHPAVWWVSGAIRTERENCCDDMVVEATGDARAYAVALATLEQRRALDPAAVLAATGGSLMKRIRRLVRQPDSPRAASAPGVAAGLLVVSAALALAGWQSKPAVAAPAAQPQASQQATPAQTAEPASRAADPDRSGAYRKWLHEDVAYIITERERAAFESLATDEERDHFIEQFWLRRDPTPGTEENEFKQEHYRRIAYANEHFASTIAGWKTDRGRIYITYGPPDEIESHPFGSATSAPFEQWLYRHIEGIGTNIIVEFVDPTMTHEYRMTSDPHEKDARPGAQAAPAGSNMQLAFPRLKVAVEAAGGTADISVPIPSGTGPLEITVFASGQAGTQFVAVDEAVAAGGLYRKSIALAPGSYRLMVVLKDTGSRLVHTGEYRFRMN